MFFDISILLRKRCSDIYRVSRVPARAQTWRVAKHMSFVPCLARCDPAVWKTLRGEKTRPRIRMERTSPSKELSTFCQYLRTGFHTVSPRNGADSSASTGLLVLRALRLKDLSSPVQRQLPTAPFRPNRTQPSGRGSSLCDFKTRQTMQNLLPGRKRFEEESVKNQKRNKSSFGGKTPD